MVRLIMGVKGSGKTKQLIELINAAAKDEAGNVVCIEPKRDMSYNICLLYTSPSPRDS